MYTVNNLMIICLTGYKGKTCWKTDCDRTKTKTEYKLETERNCSGKLTTILTVTDPNGQENQYEKPAVCTADYPCKIPNCPKPNC